MSAWFPARNALYLPPGFKVIKGASHVRPLPAYVWLGLWVIHQLPLFIIAKKGDHPLALLAFVPIGNVWLMCDMVDANPLLCLLFLFPPAALILMVYLWWQIAEYANKPGPLGALMVIPLLNIPLGWYLAVYEPAKLR
ncbi:MAG: hypothetical protein H7308_05470 [Chthonomonadaceae bacterium]|nr:hypothetical protein [Chthonomonadaceae bacterium]